MLALRKGTGKTGEVLQLALALFSAFNKESNGLISSGEWDEWHNKIVEVPGCM